MKELDISKSILIFVHNTRGNVAAIQHFFDGEEISDITDVLFLNKKLVWTAINERQRDQSSGYSDYA